MQFFTYYDLSIGINLGNSLDSHTNSVGSETAWGNPRANQAIFDGIKAQGFNLVRIPVTWMGHVGGAPNFTISEARLRRVAEVVNLARNAGLKVIINMHHDGATSNPQYESGWLTIRRAMSSPANREQITAQFRSMWVQIAEYFQNYGEWLIFQGFNELHSGHWGWTPGGIPQAHFDLINNWNQVFSDAVRSTGGNNTYRFLVFSGYVTNYRVAGDYRSGVFTLPDDPTPGRQIMNFHYYRPDGFALHPSTPHWPNNSHGGSRVFVDNLFREFRETFVDNGIPVIIGEIGPVRHGPSAHASPADVELAMQNRLEYATHVYAAARMNGLVPVYWDNGNFGGGGERFGLFNRNNGQPNSPESAEVIRAMVDAVNNASPPW
ncbi:MAG: glycoside hydrolase family 5 protein [Treponema sp.]|nr:glycoside hydrolase family 5 protein [Treponema sp.]